jgi:orotate phosphoribosyltransferase-like protein
VRDSAGLSAVQRQANLAGTFARSGAGGALRPPGVLLVLVDDVVTSGATLTEAAAVLAGPGRRDDPPVLAAVVAATPRRVAEEPSAGAPRIIRAREVDGTGPPVDRLSGPVRSD